MSVNTTMNCGVILTGLAALLFTGCSGTSSSSKGVVNAVPIRAARVSNNSRVTFIQLNQSSATFVPGAYAFSYARTAASAVTRIDQNVNAVWSLTIDQTQSAAQSFRPVNDANLSVISPELQWVGGEAVTVSLYSGGIPGQGTPTLLGSATQTLAGSGTGRVNFTFSSAPPILGGSTYYFTIDVAGTGSILWFSDNVDTSYPDGTSYVRAPGMVNFQPNTYDMTFSIEMSDTTHTYTYNGVSSSPYGQYPVSQSIIIDGGAAGKLTFVPDSSPPLSTTTSDVVAAVK